jgi:FkbM family methyltransferase
VSFARRLAARFGHDLRPLHKSDALDVHLQRFFAERDIGLIIDCGAFTGTFGKKCRAAGYRGDIVSFEPSERQFRTLETVAAADGRWTALNSGLGEQSGSMAMNVSTGAGDLNSLYSVRDAMAGQLDGLEMAAQHHVTIERLDAVLDGRGVATDVPLLIKSDTQGHDLSVLKGAGSRLDQARGLLLEMSVQPLYQGTPTHWDVLEFVRSKNFEPYCFSSLARDKRGDLIEYDALFTPRIRQDGGTADPARPTGGRS